MKRIAVIIIIAALFISLFSWMFLPNDWDYAVSGYGGLSSTINDIQLQGYENDPTIDYNIGPVIGTLIPQGGVLTGVRLELGQPQYTGNDLRYENHIEQSTESGTWVRDWEVRLAYFDLSWTVITDSGGFLPIGPVHFTIELQENQFDVFTAADEVEAYILEVVTTEPATTNDAINVKVSPGAGGFAFDLIAMDTQMIPSWMSDAGYQGALSDFKHIKFICSAESIQPTQILHLRSENLATWHCQVRALVFGFWEVLSPYDKWEDPIVFGWWDWLDDIFKGLELIIGLAVGILLSVVVLKFVPNKMFAGIILILLWAFVILGFGFLELLV